MRLRLILSFVLVVLVSIVTVVVIARLGAAVEVRNYMFRGGASGTEGLVTALEDYYVENGTWAGAETLLLPAGRGRGGGRGQRAGGMGNQRLRLADAQGRVVTDTQSTDTGGTLTEEELAQAISLHQGRQTVGYLLPAMGVNFSNVDETMLVQRINRAALIAGLFAGGLSLLLALILAYRLLRPVRELTAAAEQMSQGDLSQRVPVRGDDELAHLGRTFNSMAASLQQAETGRRALTADIAHELRNPLAVQRANLEALQDGIYALNSENLQPILEQNLLLSRLVDDLRTLALAESGQIQLERHLVDLPALARRVVEGFYPAAQAAQIEILAGSGPDGQMAAVLADPGRIEQILGNLISNALRHTPAGGQIRVSWGMEGSWPWLQVSDSGAGIPDESLSLIFERFYRVDRSRSRAEGGTGLGLAIARQLAEAHEGTLTAANHPRDGAVFTLRLPPAAAQTSQEQG